MPNKFIRHGASVDGDGLTSALATSATVTFDTGTDTVTWTGHTFANGDRVYFTTTGALPTGLTANTAYFVRDQATNTFKVAATAGGAAIDLTGTPSGTHTGISSGAWNTINRFTGTAPTRGAIAAGDVIYIRSKDESGNNLSFPTGVNRTIGSSSATLPNPITWVLDDGNVWSGIKGTLTFTFNEWEGLSGLSWNRYIAEAQDAIVLVSSGTGRSVPLFNPAGCYSKGFKLDATTMSTGNQPVLSSSGTHENLHIIGRYTSGALVVATYWQYTKHNMLRLVNPHIELNVSGITGVGALFGAEMGDSAAGAYLVVVGGKVTGVGAGEGYWRLCRAAGQSACIEIYGLSYPKGMPTLQFGLGGYVQPSSRVLVVGADSGYGSYIGSNLGDSFDSRNLLYNYPTLNAVVPDSVSTPWSWRGVPSTETSIEFPLTLRMGKLFTDTAAVKTITVEMLVSDSIAASKLDRSSIWMTVCYNRSSDGTYVTETTRLNFPGTAIDTSYASWSAVVWGTVDLLKKKLSLTTSSAIKKDTMVMIELGWAVGSLGTDDIFFVCPDTAIS